MQPIELTFNPDNRPDSDHASGDRPALQASPLSDSADGGRSRSSPRMHSWNWLDAVQQCSHVLAAVITPKTLGIVSANDPFCLLTGLPPHDYPHSAIAPSDGSAPCVSLRSVVSSRDFVAIQQLYHRQILYRVLRDRYQIEPSVCRVLNEPILLTIESPLYRNARYIRCWLRSDRLQITCVDDQRDECAALGLQTLSDQEVQIHLTRPACIDDMIARIDVSNYRTDGFLLLEGVDVTDQESIRRITQLLIDQNSILKPHQFERINNEMRQLFGADNTVIVSVDGEQVRLFAGSVSEDLDIEDYSFQSLKSSHLMRAIATNQILTVPDLAQDCHTDIGHRLLALGVRSLLLIPLMTHASESKHDAQQPIGVVCLISNQPYQFDGLNCCHAEQLIPVFAMTLTAALRQLRQRRLLHNIHPAVEWRFVKEAERRNWGLPPEAIVFDEVYPLYGISDIRGSSAERNRAIQADLLTQFRLGLAVIEAVCEDDTSELTHQIHLDMLDHLHRLQQGVTVDAEITGIRYLSDRLEVYFDHFAQYSPAAKAAIEAYQSACNPELGCVYNARARYDAMLAQINSTLRQTWERWQERMQAIIPHYCDIEVTDGIDHMMYVGASIYPQFSPFCLKSLRYEQLRAVCDCARSALLLAESDVTLQVSHLVLVQDTTVDIFHDEETDRLFDVRGTRDSRYEIVKKRIDKAIDDHHQTRITQPGKLTIVYSTEQELNEYQEYLRYLIREGWIASHIESGTIEPIQDVNGLKFLRAMVVLPSEAEADY